MANNPVEGGGATPLTHNRHDAMNKLKPLITNEVVEIVRKGQDGRNIPNVTNYIAFTNFEDALVIDENDRRWGVFFTPFEDRAALLAAGMDVAYFERLHVAVDRHADVLRAWLLDIDLSAFNPKTAPPMTAAKASMIANSLSPDAVMVKELIDLGREGVGKYVLATDCLNNALKADFGLRLSTSRLSAVLAEIGWQAASFQLWWEGKARRIYLDPSAPWPDGEAAAKSMAREGLTDAVRGEAPVDQNSPLDIPW